MGSAFVALFLLAAEPGVQTGSVGEPTVAQAMAPQLLSGLFPGQLEVEASIESQSRAGETPIVANASPEAFVAELLIPRLALYLRRPDLTLSAWYAPRIFIESPTPPGTSGALILHTFGLSLNALPSSAVTVTGSVAGSVGEPDYMTLPLVLGTTQAALPGVTVIDLASVLGQANIRAKVTRRLELTLAGQVFFWHLINEAPGLAATTIAGQVSGSAELGAMFQLTPLDAIGLSTTVGDAAYSYGVSLVTVTPAAIWRTRLGRREELRMTLGASYAQEVGTPLPGTMPLLGPGVSPIGSIDLAAHLARRDDIVSFGHVWSGVYYFLDPVLGVATPRGFGGVELGATSASGWTTGLRGDFAAALMTTPYPVPPGQLPPDQTAFSVTLSVRRRVSEYLLAELGGRWADRGPALVTPDFQFHQRQLWVYLSVTGTTRPVARTPLPVN